MKLNEIYKNIRDLLPKRSFTSRELIEETPPRIYELDCESLEHLKVTQWNKHCVYTLLALDDSNSSSFRNFLEKVEEIVGNDYNVPKERGQAHYSDENILEVYLMDSYDPNTLKLEVDFNKQQLKAESEKK